MSQALSSHNHVYRIATRSEWSLAQTSGKIIERPIDKKDGYFHLSTREQVLETANLHFKSESDLLALEFKVTELGSALKFELAAKRGDYFPHFYGSLKTDDVTAVIPLLQNGGEFSFGLAQ